MQGYKTLHMSELAVAHRQNWLQHAVAPRPIALVSTIDAQGQVNLSPFSFFNLFSSNPPILIFSPARRGRDNTTKHTLQNAIDWPECVVHIADESMVQQLSLSSCEYPKQVNEFDKAGFTAKPATLVKPPIVAEAPIALECKIIEIKSLGTEGGAGQLVIAEVLCMHVKETVLNQDQSQIDLQKINYIARLGGDWYCKVNAQNLFVVPKPNTQLGIGVDALPEAIRHSKILTGNNLGLLANVTEIPTPVSGYYDNHVKQIVQYYSLNTDEMEKELHIYAQQLLNENKVDDAWQVLLMQI
jgi:flavin reductase (DIM6/NTAB) family NADH-FMN oxidoreductase RutF